MQTTKERLERKIAAREKFIKGIREIAQSVAVYGSGRDDQRENSGSHDLALDLPSGIRVREENAWTMNGGSETITVYYGQNGEQPKEVLKLAEDKLVLFDDSPDWQKAMRGVIARWPKILAKFELGRKKAEDREKKEQEQRAREAEEWRKQEPLRERARELRL